MLKHLIGTYNPELGCLYTIYSAYPEIPIYDIKQNPDYFIPLVEKYFKRTEKEELGGLLIFKFSKLYHFGIYSGSGYFWHACEKFKLRKSKLERYKRHMVSKWLRL